MFLKKKKEKDKSVIGESSRFAKWELLFSSMIYNTN